MIWYKRYMADYARKTKGLRPLEHGIYTLMLDTYYLSEDPLPTEPDLLYRMIGAFTDDEQAAARKILRRYWTKTEDGYIQGRAREEIAIAAEKSDQTRLAAMQRWRNDKVKRYEEDRERKRVAEKATADADAEANAYTDADADGHADAYASQSQISERESEEEIEEGLKSARASAGASKQRRRKRIDPDFEPSESDLEWANAEGYAAAEVETETASFVDHWVSKGDSRLEWGRSWRNWMRNTRKFGSRNGGNKAEDRFQQNLKVAGLDDPFVSGDGL